MADSDRDPLPDGEAPGPRTVGVLGGMSAESTVEYYRRLNRGVNDALGGHHAADAVVRSVNFADVEAFIADDRWTEAGEYLAAAAGDLEAAGADCVVMATNTMHRVAPRIVEELSIPFLHIVDATARAVRAAGVGTVGVLGTETTMEAPFYRERFADHGIDAVVPDRAGREDVDRIVFEELVEGVVREESRARYLEVVEGLGTVGAEGVVLGCTEIEMLVGDDDLPDLPVFDTTACHVDRAVEFALDGVETG